ncbi:MAG: hypothetical protein WBD36_00820 [Bacteroidota bacterium]
MQPEVQRQRVGMKLGFEYRWLDGAGRGAPFLLFFLAVVGLGFSYEGYYEHEIALLVIGMLWFIANLYQAVAQAFNKTIFIVSQTEITIRHGMLSRVGNKVVKVSDIRWFERKDRSNEGFKYYSFRCVLKSPRHVNLFWGAYIENPASAEDVLKKIAAWLNHEIELRNF